MDKRASNQRLSLEELKESAGWQPDGRRGDHWVGITTMVHNARDLRSVLVNMAYAAHADPGSEVLYVLLKSRMSSMRIDQEVDKFRALIAPKIGEAMRVCTCDDPGSVALMSDLPNHDFRLWLQTLVSQHLASPHKSSSRDAVVGMIYLLLLADIRTTSATEVGAWSGASQPTVSGVLKEFAKNGAIARERGKVILKEFPSSAWSRWVAHELDGRKQVRYVSESAASRVPIETVLTRLQELHRPDIAIGGILGAEHYRPGLQSVDVEHIELTLHGTPNADLSFVHALDPSLSRSRHATDADAARLTINFLQRPTSFFDVDGRGVAWTDPVTCLIDLHAAGLPERAHVLLQHLLLKIGSQQGLF